jgi:hypothetical protein
MKSFLIQTISFILLVSILWCILSYIVDSNLKKVEVSYFSHSEYFAGGVDADVLISGNSRARGDFSPHIIDSILNVNSYNIGMDGLTYPVQIALYQVYLEHNKNPDYIIQSVDDINLTKDIPREESFLAYLDDPVISDLLKKYGNLKWFEYYLPFKYVYRPQALFYGVTEFLGIHHKTSRYKGYEGLNKTWQGDFDRLKVEHPEGEFSTYDSDVWGMFEDYIKDVLNQQTGIVLVFAPQYIESQEYVKNREEAVSFYRNLAEKYQLLFLDYSQDSISYSKDYFYDTQHLNAKGSELFSRKLANDLKGVIK